MAVQVLTAVMIVLKDTDVELQPTTTATQREPQHTEASLRKAIIQSECKDRYTELFNFVMDIMNILEMKNIWANW